ncbi:hypothetical protein MMC19_001239 [Ptychographa xylographoides]|nr:hypothetical protein [Ptychographa xylographoides]
MHDLRRQALESGKTVSRKAKSKQSSTHSSRANSATNSRAGSKAASRAASDDEGDGDLSDETSFSVNSIDEMIATDESEAASDRWKLELVDRIEEIIDKKRSSVQGREAALAAYIRILTAVYAADEIRGKEMELVASFLKSIKAEISEKEAILAMKALAMTLITSPSDAIYDASATLLKRTITDSASVPTKSAAIHTLGTSTFYGGASEDEILENMTYLVEIISSDGAFIEAQDEAVPVITALEEWGFLATLVEDLSEESEDAMDAFVEQLGSSDPMVQIAAGENIALLFEKSYTPPEDNEVLSDSDEDVVADPDDDSVNGQKLVKRYTAYRRTDQLIHTLTDLSKLSTRSLSRKDKKSIHTNFADILNSVENPTRGPRYQNAISHETGKRYGSRMAVRIHRDGIMRIDKWWKLMRLKGLRRVLQGGFVSHYQHNGVVFESLPIMITTDRTSGKE